VGENGTIEDLPAAFPATLDEMLVARRIPRAELARRIGYTRASVSDWVAGRSVPAPATLFAIERALEIGPGRLSRLFGFVPIEAVDRPRPTVLEAIAEDPALDNLGRRLLSRLYEELVRASGGASGAGPTRSKG
jgi:transcriptional regulator with XRE-family HTH domain